MGLLHKSTGVGRRVVLCLMLTVPPGQVARVIDGDTLALYHVGVGGLEYVRVLDVDTPERRQPGWAEARAATEAWVAEGPMTMTLCRRDKYGRYVGVIERDGVKLADVLRKEGHVK